MAAEVGRHLHGIGAKSSGANGGGANERGQLNCNDLGQTPLAQATCSLLWASGRRLVFAGLSAATSSLAGAARPGWDQMGRFAAVRMRRALELERRGRFAAALRPAEEMRNNNNNYAGDGRGLSQRAGRGLRRGRGGTLFRLELARRGSFARPSAGHKSGAGSNSQRWQTERRVATTFIYSSSSSSGPSSGSGSRSCSQRRDSAAAAARGPGSRAICCGRYERRAPSGKWRAATWSQGRARDLRPIERASGRRRKWRRPPCC